MSSVQEMPIQVMVLGEPGSGKSTVARGIEKFMNDTCWLYPDEKLVPAQWRPELWRCEHINDYPILQDMVEEEMYKGWLRWLDAENKYKGFDVVNKRAFDIALKRLEKKLQFQLHSSASKPCLTLIEFSRNDYAWAFQQFEDPTFLQDVYFIFVRTKIEICKERIHKRARDPRFVDDYDVSDYIFNTYYNHDDSAKMADLLRSYGIPEKRLFFFDNDQEQTQLSLQDIQTFLSVPLFLEEKQVFSQEPAVALTR